jgi:uncharacterized membrane protein
MRVMDWFLTYSGLFFFGGAAGWVLELFFRRFVSQKKWVNPGFLTGPILPLYGFGLVGFYVFSNEIPWSSISSLTWLNTIIEILCIGALMTAIEYIAGLIFIKGMKIKLWDYSNRWGNVQGIICPLFSLIWLIVGCIYLFALNPFFVSFAGPDGWILNHSVGMTFVLGFFYGILVVDLGWSLGLTTRIRKAVADSKLVVDWDKIKVSFQEHYRSAHERIDYLLPFKAKRVAFNDLMAEYVATLRSEMSIRQKAYQMKIERKRQRQLEKAADKALAQQEKANHDAK